MLERGTEAGTLQLWSFSRAGAVLASRDGREKVLDAPLLRLHIIVAARVGGCRDGGVGGCLARSGITNWRRDIWSVAKTREP